MLQINSLAAKIGRFEAPIQQALARVTASGWLVLGPEVRQFEQAFAAYVGAGYCVGLANGTDALELGLRALGVASGQRVATVANAGMYASTAILAIGAAPEFMDVDPATQVTTLAEVERVLDAGVAAVVVTHLYGQAIRDIAHIASLCAARGVPLLEDCAQAHGARIDGRCTGSFGDAAAFSFYPTKNLGALGDGGAVVTSSEKLAARVAQLRQYGWSAKYQVELAGARNSRLDEMQAALLSAFLPALDADNARRRAIVREYASRIGHSKVQLPAFDGADDGYVAHLCVVRSPDREGLRGHLRAQGIGSDVHYPIPDHRQPLFGDRYAAVRLPHTERLAAEVLTLPCYPEMTDAQVEQVIDAVNQWQAA